MSKENQKKIIGLLGVGFDTEDGHIRLTKGDNHDILMGSEQSHEYLQKLLVKIEEELKRKQMNLEDIDPDDFKDFVQSIM